MKSDAFLDRRPTVTFWQRFQSCRTEGVGQYARAYKQLDDVVSVLAAYLREGFDGTQLLENDCSLRDLQTMETSISLMKPSGVYTGGQWLK